MGAHLLVLATASAEVSQRSPLLLIVMSGKRHIQIVTARQVYKWHVCPLTGVIGKSGYLYQLSIIGQTDTLDSYAVNITLCNLHGIGRLDKLWSNIHMAILP